MKIYKIKNAILKCYKRRRFFILLSKERGRKTKFKKKCVGGHTKSCDKRTDGQRDKKQN
jgi:hypothetical protein